MAHYVYRSQPDINPQRFIARLVRTPHVVSGEPPLVFGQAQSCRGLAVTVRFALPTTHRQPVVRNCEPREACGRMAMRLRLVGPVDPIDTH